MKDLSVLATVKGGTFADSVSSYRGRNIIYNIIYLLSKYFDVKYSILIKNAKLTKKIENVELIKVPAQNRVNFDIKMTKAAKEFLKGKKISIVHHILFSYYDYNSLALFQTIKDYPFVIGPVETAHMILEDDYALWRKRDLNSIKFEYKAARCLRKCISPTINYSFKKTLANCDTLIAVNNETKQAYGKIVESKKIEVIPFGVFVEDFPVTKPPLNHDILTAGASIKRKGFEYLIRAMPDILKEYPDTRLHILGDGPDRKRLESIVKNLDLLRNVIFHGYVSQDNLLSFYRYCRVFCHPSLSEAFSPIRIEAMASGRPVVVTEAASGASEMVEHGTSGFLVPPANSSAIADSILRIFCDDELTYRMGIKARNKVEKEYDWNKLAKKYYNIYHKMSAL